MSKYDAEYMATQWTNAYHQQAQKCTDEWGNTVMGMNPDGMKSILTDTFSTTTDVTSGIESAVNEYWSNAVLSSSTPPAGGIVGMANQITGTGTSIEFSLTPVTISSVEGSLRIVSKDGKGLYNKTLSIPTEITYLKAGSPPTIDVATSTLR